jgi:hypothetical protein
VEVLQTLPSRTTPLDKLLTLKGRDCLLTHTVVALHSCSSYATWICIWFVSTKDSTCVSASSVVGARAPASCLMHVCCYLSALCHHLTFMLTMFLVLCACQPWRSACSAVCSATCAGW